MTDTTAAQRFEQTITNELAADFELANGEHGSFALAIDCVGIYGVDTRWIEVALKAGTYVVENSTMGGDPAPGTYKALYVPKGAIAPVAAPPVAPEPVPVPPTTAPVPVTPPAPEPGTVPPAAPAPQPAPPVPVDPPVTPAAPPPAAVKRLFSDDSPVNQVKAFRPQVPAVVLQPSPEQPFPYAPMVASSSLSTGLFRATADDPIVVVQTAFGPVSIRMPPNVQPAPGGDGHGCILELDGKLTNFYDLRREADGWRSDAAWSCDANGTGVPVDASKLAGCTAAGVSAAWGLITAEEYAESDKTKPFPHALRISLGVYEMALGPVFPAVVQDNDTSGYAGAIPMGALFMIDPAADLSGISDPDIRRIGLTCQIYGAFVTDTNRGTPVIFYAEQGTGFDRDWHAQSDMDILRKALVRCEYPLMTVALPEGEVTLTTPVGTATVPADSRSSHYVNITDTLGALVTRSARGVYVLFENGLITGPVPDVSGRYQVQLGGTVVFDDTITMIPYGGSQPLGPFGGNPDPLKVTPETIARLGKDSTLAPDEATMAALPLSFPHVPPTWTDTDGNGNVNRHVQVGTINGYMPETGAASQIGRYPRSVALALASRGEERCLKHLIADAAAWFQWPTVVRNADGTIPTYAQFPRNIPGNRWTDSAYSPDTAHQGGKPFALMYLLTGEDVYLRGMLRWDFWNYMNAPDSGRLYNLGFAGDYGYQVRAQAWSRWASLVDLVNLMPKDHPNRPGLVRSLKVNIAIDYERYVTGSFPENGNEFADPPTEALSNPGWMEYAPPAGQAKNPLGLLNAGGNYEGAINDVPMWQICFKHDIVMHGARMKLDIAPESQVQFDAIADFACLMQSRFADGWPFQRMASYHLTPFVVQPDGTKKWAKTWGEAFTLSGHDSLGPIPAGLENTLITHDANNPVEWLGSFEANELPALVEAYARGKDRGALKTIFGTTTLQTLLPDPTWSFTPPGITWAQLRAIGAGSAAPVPVASAPAPASPPAASPPATPAPTPAAPSPAPAPAGATPLTTDGYEVTTEFLPELPAPASQLGWPAPYPSGFKRTLAHPQGFVPLVNVPMKATGAVAGQIVTIPGSALTNFVPITAATGNYRHVLDVWSAGAWAPKARQFWVGPSGGHGGGSASVVFGIETNGFTGHMFYTPSPLIGHNPDPNSPDQLPGPEYPQAVHQYGSDQIVTDTDGKEKLFFIAAGNQPFLFDPSTGSVEGMQPVPCLNGGEGLTGVVTRFDPKRKGVWLHSHGNGGEIKFFDLAARRWYHVGDSGNPDTWNNRTVMLLNPIEDELIILVGANRGVYNTSTGPIVRFGRFSLLTLKGTWAEVPFMIPDNYTGCIDPIAKDVLIFATDPATGQGAYWSMDRLTGVTQQLAVGGPCPGWNGTWNDLAFDDQRDEFIALLAFDQDLTSFKRKR